MVEHFFSSVILLDSNSLHQSLITPSLKIIKRTRKIIQVLLLKKSVQRVVIKKKL